MTTRVEVDGPLTAAQWQQFHRNGYSHCPDRLDMGLDVRNGPTRRREQPYEQQFRGMVSRGEFTPVFQA